LLAARTPLEKLNKANHSFDTKTRPLQPTAWLMLETKSNCEEVITQKKTQTTAGNSYQHMQETKPNEIRTWFSYLVQHLARKRSGPILTTPEPSMAKSLIQIIQLYSVIIVGGSIRLFVSTQVRFIYLHIKGIFIHKRHVV